jgi:anti-sigma-K factor RskA
MLTDRTQPAYTASFGRDGAIRLAAVTPVTGAAAAVPGEERSWQLWVLPPGAPAPTSLGLVPRNERSITVQAPAVRPVPGMLIEITLEPPGGSPTGRPTGPVQFIGRLSQPGPDA